ncbi:MAG: MBL fold metallo-hydrolase [Candidatus Odinarchaeum yellowstonii]|uniref:MBL fold metallo-hydrolase n=1 Tax=Odinarchaeota yellowstonii (strain LCB_4) TaxID=1841599 RepID=A0AAF0IB65_ODILC|nr:MAG: MBL fold metallo-hydrolase [Candidatus Odinarchaeum yellowstonii]
MVYELITPEVIRVYDEYRSDIGFSNAYLILGERVILIDTGVKSKPTSILEALKSVGKSLDDISYILLTHTHPDILGGLKWLSSKSKAIVCCSQPSADLLKNSEDILVKSFGVNKNFNLLLKHKGVDINFKSFNPGKIIVDKTILGVGDIQLVVIESKGHCNGHLCFWIPQYNILFSGDELYPYFNKPNMFMIDRTGSFSKRVFSLKLFKELKPQIICQVHDLPLVYGAVRAVSSALEIQDCWRSAVLEYFKLYNEASLLDVEKYVFRCFNVKLDSYIEKLENHSTILKILEFLEEEGLIEKTSAKSGAIEKQVWRIKNFDS